jgi:hypothetical protein
VSSEGYLINPYVYDDRITTPLGLTIDGPYLLYDTRTWTGGDIENTAPGGPDWPLSVLTTTDRGVTYQFAAHQVFETFHSSVLGGDPASKPLTFVAGLGPLNLVDGGAGDWSEAANNHMARFETIGYGTICWADGRRSGELASPHYGEIEADSLLMRVGTTLNNRSITVQPGYSDFPATPFGYVVTPPGLADKVVIGCLDMTHASSAGWIDDSSVPIFPGGSDLSIGPYYNEGALGTPAAFNSATSWTGRIVALGSNYPADTSGKWQTGAYAMGLYRGVPTTDDIDKLVEYFSA